MTKDKTDKTDKKPPWHSRSTLRPIFSEYWAATYELLSSSHNKNCYFGQSSQIIT